MTANALEQHMKAPLLIDDTLKDWRIADALEEILQKYNLDKVSISTVNGSIIAENTEPPKEGTSSGPLLEYEYKVDGMTFVLSRHSPALGYLNKTKLYTFTSITVLILLIVLVGYLGFKKLLGPLSILSDTMKSYHPEGAKDINKEMESAIGSIQGVYAAFKEMVTSIEEEERINKEKDKLLISQQRFAEMGRMLANIAHQWKQPLNSISITSSELALKLSLGKLDREIGLERLASIDRQINHMSDTIQVFLNFLRGEKVKSNETFTVYGVMGKIMPLMTPTMKANKIDLEFLGDDFKISGSEGELEQVLMILINNSIDAISLANPDKRSIEIQFLNIDGVPAIKLRDFAGGIDKDDLPKIFDAYYTTKHPSKGTGLGLFIARSIVNLHFGGDIFARNIEGGAEFMIKFGFTEETPRIRKKTDES